MQATDKVDKAEKAISMRGRKVHGLFAVGLHKAQTAVRDTLRHANRPVLFVGTDDDIYYNCAWKAMNPMWLDLIDFTFEAMELTAASFRDVVTGQVIDWVKP